MALVQIIDIVSRKVVAEYQVPPTEMIAVQAGQMVKFADVNYGNPTSPNAIVANIDGQDVQVTTDDGTVLFQNLSALLEEGVDTGLSFADSGAIQGSGNQAFVVPTFDSLDAIIATAAGGTGGGADAQTGTSGRGNDGSFGLSRIEDTHIHAAGVDGDIPLVEFDTSTDLALFIPAAEEEENAATQVALPTQIVSLVGDEDLVGGETVDGGTFLGPFDHRSASELAATNGAQFTDYADASYGSFVPRDTPFNEVEFVHNFNVPAGFNITSAQFILGHGGIQSNQDPIYLDGQLLVPTIANQGAYGFDITTYEIPPALFPQLLDGSATFWIDLNKNSTGEPAVFDFSKLVIDGAGGGGGSILNGQPGTDIFAWQETDIDPNTDGTVDHVDTVKGFNAVENDTLDVSQLLSDLGVAVLGDVSSYFQTLTNGSNVELQVDPSGSGGSWQTFAVIENAAIVDVDANVDTGF